MALNDFTRNAVENTVIVKLLNTEYISANTVCFET
jgi:hypothetical protein